MIALAANPDFILSPARSSVPSWSSSQVRLPTVLYWTWPVISSTVAARAGSPIRRVARKMLAITSTTRAAAPAITNRVLGPRFIPSQAGTRHNCIPLGACE
jgi:hypothetical protein